MRLCSSPPFDAVRFTTSWLIPPAVLFIVRAAISLYIFVTLFVVLGIDDHQSPSEARHEFSYFTVLTYWGLGFYFAFAAFHTAIYWRLGQSYLARWPMILQIAHSILYSTITVFPWLVTIVYWSLLYSGFQTRFDTWSNVSQHAFNSVFAFFEIVIPRTEPLPFLHVIAIVLILALYLAVAFVTFDTDHFYVYSFLDIQRHGSGVVAGYIIGILVASIVIFLIVHFVIWLRRWITETKMGKMGKFSRRGAQGGQQELEEIHKTPVSKEEA